MELSDQAELLRQNLATAFDLGEADVPGGVLSILRCENMIGGLKGLPLVPARAFRPEDRQKAIAFLRHHLWPLHDRKTR